MAPFYNWVVYGLSGLGLVGFGLGPAGVQSTVSRIHETLPSVSSR